MAQSTFSREEIKGLVEKLSSSAFELSPRERALLLAIFSAASDHVTSVSPAEPSAYAEPTLSELKTQILNAFIPGEDNNFKIDFRIGIPPPPAPSPSAPPPTSSLPESESPPPAQT
jgi:hypothetical protein